MGAGTEVKIGEVEQLAADDHVASKRENGMEAKPSLEEVGTKQNDEPKATGSTGGAAQKKPKDVSLPRGQSPGPLKEKTLDMVNQFVKDAVTGQPCTWVDEADGELVKATYRVCGKVLVFHLTPQQGAQQSFEMKRIHDVTKDVRETCLAKDRKA